jgi:DNA primase
MRKQGRKAEKTARNHVQLQGHGEVPPGPAPAEAGENAPPPRSIRPTELDRLDRELVEILLNDPALVGEVIHRVPAHSPRDEPLRHILGALYDLHGEGQSVSFDRLALRLQDAGIRALAAGLLLPLEPMPIAEKWQPAPWPSRLANLLPRLAERDRQDRIREIEGALAEIDAAAEPEQYRRLQSEKWKLKTQRPDTSSPGALGRPLGS